MGINNVGIDADALFGGSGGQRREYLQNIGVKRISGLNLIQEGQQPLWLFLIEEIQSLAVLTPINNVPVWMGAWGQPVAGPNEVRDSLIAAENMKFWSTDDSRAYEFAGGQWQEIPSDVNPNPLYPATYVPVNGPRILNGGRKYIIQDDAEVTLPLASNSLDGHYIQIEIIDGIEANLAAPDPEQLFVWNGQEIEYLSLQNPVQYKVIFSGGKWHLFANALPQQLYDQLLAAATIQAQRAEDAAAAADEDADRSEDAAEQAIIALETIIRGAATTGIWNPNDGEYPVTPAELTGTWIVTEAGTFDGISYNTGDTLIWLYPAEEFDVIRTGQQLQTVNGKTGFNINLTPEDVNAVSRSDLTDLSQPVVITQGWRGAPTLNDAAIFYTSANFNPASYLLRSATTPYTRNILVSTTPEEFQEFSGLGNSVLRDVGTGLTDLVATSQLNTRLGTTQNLSEGARRNVSGEGNLITEGYQGLGGAAVNAGWNGTQVTSRFQASTTNSPLPDTGVAGISVKNANYGMQLAARASRVLVRTNEGTTYAAWHEFPVVRGRLNNMATNVHGTNANNYTFAGSFTVTGDVSNLPVATDGTLRVGSVIDEDGNLSLTQEFLPYSNTNPEHYFRASRAGTFSPWSQALLASNLGSAAARNVGELAGEVMEVGAFGGPEGSEQFWHTGNLTPSDYALNASFTSVGNALRTAADAAAGRSALALGNAATRTVGTAAGNLQQVGAFNGPTGGQSYYHTGNLDLSEYAFLGTGNAQVRTNSQNDGRFLQRANNLTDISNVATARNHLEVLQAGTSGTQVRNNSQNDARFLQSVSWGIISEIPTTASRWPTFAEVTSKPATYPPTIGTTAATACAGNDARLSDARTPTSHTHPWSQITSIPTTASRWPTWGEVTSKPSTFAPSSHSHTAAQVPRGSALNGFTVSTSGPSGGSNGDFWFQY